MKNIFLLINTIIKTLSMRYLWIKWWRDSKTFYDYDDELFLNQKCINFAYSFFWERCFKNFVNFFKLLSFELALSLSFDLELVLLSGRSFFILFIAFWEFLSSFVVFYKEIFIYFYVRYFAGLILKFWLIFSFSWYF